MFNRMAIASVPRPGSTRSPRSNPVKDQSFASDSRQNIQKGVVVVVLAYFVRAEIAQDRFDPGQGRGKGWGSTAPPAGVVHGRKLRLELEPDLIRPGSIIECWKQRISFSLHWPREPEQRPIRIQEEANKKVDLVLL